MEQTAEPMAERAAETGRMRTPQGACGTGATRRGLLALIGAGAGAGALALAGCNDDVVGAEAVPQPTPTPGTATTPVPVATYDATDTDRANFALQLHYLLGAYLQAGLGGDALPAALTGGTGSAGAVTGGRRVGFADAALVALLREVTGATVARITYLRGMLGAAATAQPAITIAGGADGPFEAIAHRAPAAGATTPSPSASPTPAPFDPYASDADFLLGAVALFAVATGAVTHLAAGYAEPLRASMGALAAGVAAGEAACRNALFVLAAKQPPAPKDPTTLFARAAAMSDGRDQYDGPADRDVDLGANATTSLRANIDPNDTNGGALRRTPEQALGVLYATSAAAVSGGFFPAGVNGTIRTSGRNA
ncbi:ferritin-like domain-containing protein [Sphingomonas sp. BK235]|uniref:ferritin-like domain-containing protein n=1 Tax=Sphingomonas sp. BK235 TaxID=2512131 RepID=UPI0010473DBC|nr:ferritin-like domain-containing protein [Sphingomonas sp. BK235]TCP31830.1 ferritin-like protein [Sphingomonas sp. BK235]